MLKFLPIFLFLCIHDLSFYATYFVFLITHFSRILWWLHIAEIINIHVKQNVMSSDNCIATYDRELKNGFLFAKGDVNFANTLLTLGACARELQYSSCVCVCVCVCVLSVCWLQFKFIPQNELTVRTFASFSRFVTCRIRYKALVREISFFSRLFYSFRSINSAQVAPYTTRGCNVSI